MTSADAELFDTGQYPERLYVETTTRCNLRCSMCMKHAQGNCLEDADMSLETFARLDSVLPHVRALLLNGIGEPLLHPHLVEMVARARSRMPADGWIGFQSNGLMLTAGLAADLLRAGLDTMCLSVDSIVLRERDTLHGGGNTAGLERAFRLLREAREDTGRKDFRIGAEFVVMRKNLHELPDVVRWAGEQGAAFLLASHVLPYDVHAAEESVFTPDTPQARALYARWRDAAAAQGLNLAGYYAIFRRFHRTEEEKRLVALVQAMQQEASGQGIYLHLKRLIEREARGDTLLHEEVAAVFDRAREAGERCGVEVRLPAVSTRTERRCDFVEDGSVFITSDGGVHPCYFLWHAYSCHLDGQRKIVRPQRFGCVLEQPLEDIWRSAEYRRFRQEVCAYDYPDCSSCTMGPCDDMTGEMGPFEADCHGVTVPCGHCPWCLGGLQCLL